MFGKILGKIGFSSSMLGFLSSTLGFLSITLGFLATIFGISVHNFGIFALKFNPGEKVLVFFPKYLTLHEQLRVCTYYRSELRIIKF